MSWYVTEVRRDIHLRFLPYTHMHHSSSMRHPISGAINPGRLSCLVDHTPFICHMNASSILHLWHNEHHIIGICGAVIRPKSTSSPIRAQLPALNAKIAAGRSATTSMPTSYNLRHHLSHQNKRPQYCCQSGSKFKPVISWYFFLASLLTFFLAYFLAFRHSFWHLFGHSFRHIF